MSNKLQKIAAFHDLSGFGRGSLTTILPVMATFGIQTCPIPTALLSTQSDGFPGFYFQDLSAAVAAFSHHWAELELYFDCMYSGFLGSEQQIEQVLHFFRVFKKNTDQLILVDPVMGDNGELYSTYTAAMQKKMKRLVEQADIITPNLTEACFLLDEPYNGGILPLSLAKKFAVRLSNLGPSRVVITGLANDETTGYNLAYDVRSQKCWRVCYELVPSKYPGTGDLYSCTLLGYLMTGSSLAQALDLATRYLSQTVYETFSMGLPEREGVLFEKTLPFLLQKHTDFTFEIV